MNNHIPSKIEILGAFIKMQSSDTMLLFTSERFKSEGRLKEAADSYRQLIDALRQQLDIAEINNRYYPETPFDLIPIIDQLLNALLTLADVLEGLGEHQQSETLRDEVVTLSQKYLPGTGVAERNRQHAQSLLAQSRYPEALVALYQAMDEFKRLGDPLQVASVTRNIAEVLEWLGDYSRALTEAQRATTLIEPILHGKEPSDRDIAEALQKGHWKLAEQGSKLLQVWLDLEQIIARTNQHLGHFDEARAHLRKVLPKIPFDVRPALEFQFAVIDVKSGAYELGLEKLHRIEPLMIGLMRPKLGVLQSWKAEALLGLGHPEEAKREAEFSVRELVSYKDEDSLWKAQWRMARALYEVGLKNESLESYLGAAKTVDNLRKVPLGYRLDSTYMADKLPLFEQAIHLASTLGEAETACSLIELVKSRSLTATLTISKIEKSGEETELAMQVNELSNQLDAIEYFVYRNGQSEMMVQKRDEILKKRYLLLEQIRFSDPRWRSLSDPPSFKVRKLFDLLASCDQCALTLFYSKSEIVTVLVKDHSCRVGFRPLTKETIMALDRYQVNLNSVDVIPTEFDPASFAELSADKIVPEDLLNEALNSKSLVIVPHGPLHLLPWAGLMFNGQRLFQRCPIGILPNLTCILVMQGSINPLPKIALIGSPDYEKGSDLKELPLAEEELHTIEEIYRLHDKVINVPLIGRDATQDGFRKLTRDKEAEDAIIHIACHGQFETGEPMNSGLLLTDGKLDASEIAQDRLPYSEVILSTCSSGYRPTEVLGVPLSGDDVIGLPGAFLEAGAHSVLVSITKARDDATLMLMTLYHEQRVEGVFPLFALQKAQQEMIINQTFPPYLWIGFTMYGCK